MPAIGPPSPITWSKGNLMVGLSKCKWNLYDRESGQGFANRMGWTYWEVAGGPRAWEPPRIEAKRWPIGVRHHSQVGRLRPWHRDPAVSGAACGFRRRRPGIPI